MLKSGQLWKSAKNACISFLFVLFFFFLLACLAGCLEAVYVYKLNMRLLRQRTVVKLFLLRELTPSEAKELIVSRVG